MQVFLGCRAEGCDYVSVVPGIESGMVGSKCPCCGGDLLSATEFRFFKEIMQPNLAEIADAVAEEVGFCPPFIVWDGVGSVEETETVH